QRWLLRDVPDGGGRRVAAHVQRHLDAYCPASGAARTSVRGAGIECDKQRRQGCAMTKAKHHVLCATRREPIDSAARGTHSGKGFCHGTPKNQTMALACPAIRGKTFS